MFIDESGFQTSMARNCGWAPVGEKPVLCVPKYGQHVTIIGGIALDGVRARQTLETTMDGERFVAFLDGVLGPTLKPCDVVVMDGPRVHRVAGVAEVGSDRAVPDAVLSGTQSHRDVLVGDEVMGAHARSARG